MKIKNQKSILVAPLNWGIGHATRCIPIIYALIKNGFTPILASDGDSLLILQKEFSNLKSYQLPSYNIQYAKKAWLFKLKLIIQIPKIRTQIKLEHKIIQKIIKNENIKGIISDNRFGVYSDKIPSVYITHQTNVMSGLSTFLTSKIHQKIINKFDECWVPDNKNHTLSGKLSATNKLKTKVQFIDILSRFQTGNKKKLIKNEILILLSGQEPQRTILERKLISTFKNSTKKILFIRGVFNEKNKLENTKHIEFKNYLLNTKLEKTIKESEFIIARSGYSTIMDLAILQKKVFFIPTPGQTEQEYLAKHLAQLKIAPFCKQNQFSLKKLEQIKNYSGFKTVINQSNKFNFDIFIK